MKIADFDFRIWDKGEETLTYASKEWKLSIGFSNPQQDNGETESVLHAMMANRNAPMIVRLSYGQDLWM
ncbi:hypothetical protein [Helicobacter cinaedi]|uniref:hypothetical protein n=1 Tax=Helicobacter cinaedi TaxID=213 RepID=UPI00140295F7|nr:hypothetical protein [Helicobacter cinaedi]